MVHSMYDLHKICDPVHGFIRFSEVEKKLINSFPFQRLRWIRQMGVAYLVYPGALHSRFEHSLGVMEIATKIYDTVTAPKNRFVALKDSEFSYWRQILRLAALCHDLGHLPFSHTAEDLLLSDLGHEGMTKKIIESEALRPIFTSVGDTAAADTCKLALSKGETLTPWERVLCKIITEDNFGADRIDYLLRDGLFTGVAHGQFDFQQMIDSLRILPGKEQIELGVTIDGMQSVESLWIARYMMFARVYHHLKTKVYTLHMRRFMHEFYANQFPRDIKSFLQESDDTVYMGIKHMYQKGNEDAAILLKQKKPYRFIPLSLSQISQINERELLIDSSKKMDPRKRIFPVQNLDGTISNSLEVSTFLREIPHGEKNEGIFVSQKQYETLSKALSS